MEDLRYSVSRIRDLLLKEGISGRASIENIIILILHRYFTKETCEKFSIPIEYSYENISSHTDGKAASLIYTPTPEGGTGLLVHLDKLFGIKTFRFSVQTETTLHQIREIIKTIPLGTRDFDIIGAIYELHLSSGTKDPRDLGQFFSHRQVVKYLISLANIQAGEKIIDPTCGTGGFLSMAHSDNVEGYELEESIAILARINLFFENRAIDMIDKIKVRNVLFGDIDTNADVFLCNVPFGIHLPEGDKDFTGGRCCKTLKNFQEKFDSKTEPLFLRLIMSHLNMKGRALTIFPENILFRDSKFSVMTRRFLLEYFDIKRVIKLNAKFFTNTSIKPIVLYFERNGNSTQSIDYYEFDESGEKKIDILTREEFGNNVSLSLLLNDYRRPDPREGILAEMWATLGEICNFQKGKFKSGDKIKPGDTTRVGRYPFYSATFNEPAGKHEEFSFDFPESVIFVMSGGGNDLKEDSQWGLGKAFYAKGPFACSTHPVILTIKDPIFSTKFIYHYLSNRKKIFEKMIKGSTGLKYLTMEQLQAFPVPVYSLSRQLEIVSQLDEREKLILEKEKEIEDLKEQMRTRDIRIMRSTLS